MNLIPRSFLFDDDLDDFFVTTRKNEMKCDIYEDEKGYHIDVETPGFNKEDINIEVKDGYLTVKAHKNKENNEERKNYIRRERYYGEYQRTFALGEVNTEEINAKFDNGILSITVPKKEVIENKRTIEIN